ncbi:substrate-binding periplasmic protein [Oligoflexus tunisiensis]|uniref:substrate-binding periplasmic protein n=1 Tax=Oligoflexus tunisiensis TaxID=708132 RepID=UPI00114CCCBD|nr:transporter substrate-binding domain-containing protein [Oligoflexus tunisiensis]
MFISALSFTIPVPAADKAKIITIGSPLNSPPYVYEGEGRGIEMELVASIIKKMGYGFTWRHLPPKRMRHQVLQREITVGIRSQPVPGDKLFYSRPYIQFQNVAIALDPNVQVNTVQDLSKYSVVAFQNAKDVLGPEYAKAVSRCTVYMEVANQAKQIETLFRRRSQVIILEKHIFNHFRDMFDPKSEVKIFEIFPPTQYSAVFHDKTMRDEFDRILQATQPSLTRD